VTAVVDTAAVHNLDGDRQAVRDGYVSGGNRRNLEWLEPFTDFGTADQDTRLLLADAQTSGGLLVAGEVPGAPVIGDLVPRGTHSVVLR
jgi:selenide,water dikinase